MDTAEKQEIAACCANEANRVLAEKKGSITVMQCSVCGRRHYEVVAEPGTLFAKPM